MPDQYTAQIYGKRAEKTTDGRIYAKLRCISPKRARSGPKRRFALDNIVDYYYLYSMPCSDVTELLTIELDTDDRIRSYSLTKKTCGGTMGRDSLILKMILGKRAEEIVATPIDSFYREIQFSTDLKEMVYSKHYLAVQAGLGAFLGQERRASRGVCELESVEYGPEGSAITARISVELSISSITSCGTCATCGTGAQK